MREFETGGVHYRTRDLCAYDQFHLLRKLMPILPTALAIDIDTTAVDPDALTTALGGVPSKDITAACDAAAGAMERWDEGWAVATKGVALPDMLAMVLVLVDEHFAIYLDRQQPSFRPAMGRRLDFDPVMMPDGESWLFRPCRANPPLLDMLALFDGRASLFQVAKANDVLDVEAENEFRASQAPGKP